MSSELQESTSSFTQDAYVVTSKRYSSYSPFNSIKALFNFGNKGIYGSFERPPYPIIIDVPSLKDIVSAWRFSDFVMFGSLYGTGIVWSYVLSRPFPMLMQRLIVYHGMSHLFFVAAAMQMILQPYRRLTGYADNGLRWRNPDDKLKKYDSTSHFEKATWWGRFTAKN